MENLPISEKLKIIKRNRGLRRYISVLRLFQKKSVRFGGFAGLLIFGFFVYWKAVVPCAQLPHSGILVSCFYSFHAAIHSFFPSFGGISGELCSVLRKVEEGPVLVYFIFQTLCVFYVVSLMFSLFGREVINSVIIRFCKKKDKVVIWGFSEKGLLLALDLLCNKKCKRVVFYLDKDTLKDEERKKIIDRLDSCYCSWRDVSFTNLDENVESKRYFFISENGRENIINAKRLLARLREGKKEIYASLYIRIENAAEEVFYDWLDGDIRNCANVELFKESSVSSSLLLEKLVQSDHHSVVNRISQGGRSSFKMLLLGLGHNGECALGDVVENIQRIGCSVSVDIIEKDSRKWLKYANTHKDFIREYNVNRIDMEFPENDMDFCDWLKICSDDADEARLVTYDIVLICLGNDNLALTTMAEIKKAYKEIRGVEPPQGKVFIQLDDYEQALFASKKEKLNLGFTPYGSLVEIYSCKLLGDGVVERLAKLINWVYCEGNSNFSSATSVVDMAKCEILWSKAAFFDQQSSRASARGLVRHWKRMGYEVGFGAIKTDDVPSLILTKDELAQEEHLRWMAFHYAHGIKQWRLNYSVDGNIVNVSDNLGLIGKISTIKANQRRTFNVHAALVAFEDLANVDYLLDILESHKRGQDDFINNSLDSYAGAGKKSPMRSVSCLQANDYCINELLVNTEALFKVGIVLNKVVGDEQ